MKVSDLLDRLGKLPRPQRLALYALLGVAIVALFWFLLYSPQVDDLDRLDREIVDLKSQLTQVEARAKNKEKLEGELETLKADLKQALKELPNDREIPGLLKGISTLGRNVGLEVKKFTPLPEVPRDYIAEVPVQLEVEGSYHEIAMFFDRLSKMNRIVYVRDILMPKPVDRGGKVVLTVSGRAVTFRFLTEEEIAAAQKAREGGKRRGGAKGKGGEE